MRTVIQIFSIVLGVGIGVACSDRSVEVDEEAERLCTAFCERYPECDLPSESPTVDECVESCMSYDWQWDKACRSEYIATYECVNELSCEDFAITENIVEGEASCGEQRSASSGCTAENGGIDSR